MKHGFPKYLFLLAGFIHISFYQWPESVEFHICLMANFFPNEQFNSKNKSKVWKNYCNHKNQPKSNSRKCFCQQFFFQ